MRLTAAGIYRHFNYHHRSRTGRPKYLIRPAPGRYGLRWFDRRRPKDVRSLYAIDNQEALYKYMHPKIPSNLKYYREVLNCRTSHHRDHYYVFAIVALSGDIIGWIQFSPDPHRAKISKFYKIDRGSLVLEVAYAKLFGLKFKNVAANALKRALNLVLNMDNNCLKNVYITGYTDDQNIPSIKVLRKNNFKKVAKNFYYEGDLTGVWIKKIN